MIKWLVIGILSGVAVIGLSILIVWLCETTVERGWSLSKLAFWRTDVKRPRRAIEREIKARWKT